LFLDGIVATLRYYGAIEERNDLNTILNTGRAGTGSGIDRHLY
jgi:hypothetical protein